jgi:raffinose/stachyose/melibiose transport system substrate-binding protein
MSRADPLGSRSTTGCPQQGDDMKAGRARRPRTPAAIATALGLLLALVVLTAGAATAADTTTIHVWDYGANPTTSKAYDAIYRKFEAAHPGVKIERRKFSGGDEFNAAFGPAMSAGKGPDVWAGGASDELIDGGQVLDLTPYYCSYGWNKTLNPGQVRLTQHKGKIYQIPDSVESLVIFYHRDQFRQLGVTVPKTWQQFLAIISKAKAGGITPIAFGNLDKFPGGGFWHGALLANSLGLKKQQSILFGNGSWNSPEVIDALNHWVSLNKIGAFPKASVSISYDESVSLFGRKQATMFLTGSFVLTELSGASAFTGSNVGVFLLPSWNPRVPTQATESSGNNWLANAHTSNPKLVAALLNYLLFDPASQRTLVEQTNDILAVGGLGKFKLGAQLKSIRALVDSHVPDRDSYAYLSSLVPSEMQAAFFDDMQALQIGKETPAEVAANWQKLWQKAKADGVTLHPGAAPTCG